MSTGVLVRPLVTEKNTNLGSKLNKYVFMVTNDANKIRIKTAVEKMYGVKVEAISTAIMPGKNKQRMTKTGVLKGVKGYKKKAFVTLAKGETIDFYASV
ncbi:MAG: 50S ribosomal protein L23 [Sphingobacteriales bacterium]|nr:MAG: 50S ribosomal protein L23 [Sphingobacteriales bacterium]